MHPQPTSHYCGVSTAEGGRHRGIEGGQYATSEGGQHSTIEGGWKHDILQQHNNTQNVPHNTMYPPATDKMAKNNLMYTTVETVEPPWPITMATAAQPPHMPPQLLASIPRSSRRPRPTPVLATPHTRAKQGRLIECVLAANTPIPPPPQESTSTPWSSGILISTV